MHLPPGEFPARLVDEAERIHATDANGSAKAHAVGVPAPEQTGPGQRPQLPLVRLLGVEFHALTEAQAIEFIISELDACRGGMVVTPNLDHLRRCVRDLWFAALVSEADLVVPDGMPLVWASRLQGTPLPQRVAGSDLISSLARAAAAKGRSMFLLGGAPGTAEGARAVLEERHPEIRIVGTHCPPIGFEDNADEMSRIVDALIQGKPDIVFVALGSPKQEELVLRLRESLPCTWWLGVGVSFSFLTGHVVRAPRWLQKLGLEWVHRLLQEPRRLFKRYVVQGVPFAVAMLTHALTQRVIRPFAINDLSHSRRARDPFLPLRRELRGSADRARPETDDLGTIDGLGTDEPANTPTAPAAIIRDGTHQPLQKLRSLVLLSGQLRATPFTLGIDRSVLDLPLLDDTTLLNHWMTQSSALADYARLSRLPVCLLASRGVHIPSSVSPRFSDLLSIERDASDYRGTGGVLRDMAEDFDDDDWILVGNAAQLLLEPLPVLAAALAHKQADVALVSHEDGSPSGMMLLRCKTLRLINSVGFVDMKEQALPAIAAHYSVRVVRCRRPTTLAVRSGSDYINALRRHLRGRDRGGRRASVDPLAEDFTPGFSVVEPGAVVDPSAYIHDSVILSGARVEAGCSVVRSVVGPGGVVRRGTQVMDDFVAVRRTLRASA